jgi:hypothetical protein
MTCVIKHKLAMIRNHFAHLTRGRGPMVTQEIKEFFFLIFEM